MADCTRSKIPTPRKGRLSTRSKKRKLSPEKQKDRSKERGRVDLGTAFEAWRSLKAAKGWRTDAEVALCLIDRTKTLPARLASPGASDEKIKFSKSEMEKLVEQEVHATVQESETKLHGLIETIQKLDRAVDYERSIQKLETRINRIGKRAESAIAFMKKTQIKSPLPFFVNVNIKKLDSEDKTLETSAPSESPSVSASKKSADHVEETGGIFKIMEYTKETLKKMQSQNEALKGVVADLSEERHSPVLTPYCSPEVKVKEKKPKIEQEVENTVEEPEQCEEPKAESVKVERLPLCESEDPKSADSDQVKPLYPALPTNTFPSTLHVAAASYNIPQRPQVRLALIRNPAGLSVLWNSVEEDPARPPMGSYSVYMTVEKVKGSNVFPDWTCAEVDAKPLPMCMMISKYKPGRKVCVAVVGKDKFGRFGPFSSVVTASLPE